MAYIGVSPSNGIRRVFTYTATANQTSFSGVGAENITLSYKDANYVDVYQNGVKLASGDYTATSGTAIVLGTGATVNDMVVIVVFDVFSAADTVSKADGGQFDGNVVMAGTLAVTGTTALTGNATMAGTLGVTGVLTGTSLDISGDIDVDGTTNLDVVDIDGAVDMASTLAVSGAISSSTGFSIGNLAVLGQEIDVSSGNLTIDVAGDIVLDAGGSSVVIQDDGTGIGRLRNVSSDFIIKSEVSDKDLIFKGNDGGSEITALTLDMSIGGVAKFGAAVQIPQYLTHLDDTDTFLEFGTNQIDLYAGNAKAITIGSSQVIINQDSADFDFRVESNGGTHAFVVEGGTDNVGIMNNNSSTLTAAKFNVELAGVAITGDTDGATMGDTGICQLYNSNNGTTNSTIMLLGGTSVGVPAQIASGIGFTRENSGNWGTQLRFYTHVPATSDVDELKERMRIDSAGNMYVNNDGSSPLNGRFTVYNDTSQDAVKTHQATSGTTGLWTRIDHTASYFAIFRYQTSTVGSITTNGSSTTYATSSDYRLKENVSYDFDATTRLKQLKPARFNFKTDADTTVDGFIAHEVSSIVPEAISGEKDAMTAEVLYVEDDVIPEGKKVGDVKEASVIDPQGIDQSKLVPLLVKTIQELEARITALESA